MIFDAAETSPRIFGFDKTIFGNKKIQRQSCQSKSMTHFPGVFRVAKKGYFISSIAIYDYMNSPGGDWAIISIDGAITRAKILHKSRGRYVIVEDSKEGKYVNRVIDAEDIMQVEK
jgi:hypothetical protein